MSELPVKTTGTDTPEEITLQWWSSLQDRRGDRAELKRSDDLAGIPFVAAYHDLYRRLAGTRWRHRAQLALVAGVLAYVKSDDPSRPFAAQMAAPRSGGEGAAVSGLRFRRLIQVEEPDELLPRMSRTVRMLGGRANIRDLARSLYWWRSERTRHNWAFEYYQAAPEND